MELKIENKIMYFYFDMVLSNFNSIRFKDLKIFFSEKELYDHVIKYQLTTGFLFRINLGDKSVERVRLAPIQYSVKNITDDLYPEVGPFNA